MELHFVTAAKHLGLEKESCIGQFCCAFICGVHGCYAYPYTRMVRKNVRAFSV